MNMITRNNQNIGVIEKDMKITSVQNILDLMATAQYMGDCVGIVLYKECIDESFFDLKTGFAGEMLQKFSNYRLKLAIVGDFSHYTSKSLKDFIYECNKGNLVYFKNELEDALSALVPDNQAKH